MSFIEAKIRSGGRRESIVESRRYGYTISGRGRKSSIEDSFSNARSKREVFLDLLGRINRIIREDFSDRFVARSCAIKAGSVEQRG